MKSLASISTLVGALLLALAPVTASAGPGQAGRAPAGVASGAATGPATGPAAGPAAGPASGPAAGPASGPAAGAGTEAGAWSWPLNPRPAVARAFDPPARPWLSGHRGVDLRAAHDGVPVTSPAAGTVSFAGVVVDRAVITVDHGNGLRSSFEPVRSDLGAGAVVAEGDVLGWIQPGHCGPAHCVHWGVRRGDVYLNPLGFVTDLRPSVLLPPRDPAPG
ncbi:murein DD-endopeptidase MepM/ murein hydrolase activator NlpD [Arthrobacter ginsengisoli]|uniref:Murein DD-endopeptidase MepM/ murein hydrolase activator NlpD n=1 Tax=Arthrobacter ginsengisoli TaxID=1356565 RepID=A0ABU1U891_9MICC|nr:M23 family metallopeptidase [Arthrobacter ginsengisoli]MDR7081409.1 murein DD-endopeptidase MepM/ murein hydrolase activator NlpD [Arthrobacter ginsengisoli]